MRANDFMLMLDQVELTAPPSDSTEELQVDNRGFYDKYIMPSIEDPLPTVGVLIALTVGGAVVYKALHRDPKPWLEDR